MADDSIVRNEEEFVRYFRDACEHFKSKHGFIPMQYPMASEDEVFSTLKSIKKSHKTHE
jgi:hypothetical protein